MMLKRNKAYIIRELIELIKSEGVDIKFDNQFGSDGFVNSEGEFWSTEGYSALEICRRILENYEDELI